MRRSPHPTDPHPTAAQPEPAAETVEKPQRKKREPDTFKTAVLDELHLYFPYLARMRKADRNTYDLYSKIGAQLLPDMDTPWINMDELEPWWADHRPGFGAIAVTSVSNVYDLEFKLKGKGKITPKFWYFQKYELPPARIQPLRGGDVYVVTVYWDDMHDKKHFKRGAPTEFPVLVAKDCSITVLKTLINRKIITRSRKGATVAIRQKAWTIHDIFKNWALENKTDVEEQLKRIFRIAANAYIASAMSMIQIRATKGPLAALFSIDVLKTPEFFADRELECDVSGRRKKIFHIVRPHSRITGANVRMHFRGARQFT
jgi:hypothetical protein